MKELKINIPASQKGSYHVTIGVNILSTVLDKIHNDLELSNLFVVTDENVAKAGHLKTLLGEKDIASFIISPAGECSKTIDTIISIVETMESASFGRDSAIVALGGGTVGDMAGFAAAIFKRGIPVVQIPTTTVAQADSAIGGKTGVDSSVSKNAFGVFWQPAAVFVDVATLLTLDDRQFRAGLVESVKHALIADKQYFDFIENNIGRILDRDLDVLEQLNYSNCKIKAEVVQADPNEKNQRRMLNYGHTIGHAVESASGFELLHGEAVAVGIIAASLLEQQMGLSDANRHQRIIDIFQKLQMPLKIPQPLTKNQLIDIIRKDKKAVNKWPRFVLVDKIGHVFCKDGQFAIEVEIESVEKVLDELIGNN